jgi:aryl-alcohol dehydrogenase-like predicted oxidoreductase
VVEELARLREEFGWKIGLSLTGPRQGETLARALEVEADGLRLFDAVQATWNLLEPSSGPKLAEARNAGLGVIVKEALANGRLTTRNDDPAFANSRKILQVEADRLGTTLDALALAAALAQPWADVVLLGAATVAQLRSNLTALDDAAPVDGERFASLVRDPQVYWSERAAMPWT